VKPGRPVSKVAASVPVSEELTALGPYFAVEFYGELPETAGDSPWRSMSGLVDSSSDAMAERVAGVRAYLAAGTGQADASAVELRVAASVVHLGLVARVVSPLFALAVLHLQFGRVRAADLRWQPTLGSLFPLAVSRVALKAGGASITDSMLDDLLNGVVGELGAAVTPFGVNEHILRGNVASALAGAAKTLTAARPPLRDEIRTLMDRLLDSPHLADSGGFEPDGAFRRRTCCLIYRAAPDHAGGLCGDCVLAAPRGPMDS
jgi:FhuF 2Fe-2S C-terminal domain